MEKVIEVRYSVFVHREVGDEISDIEKEDILREAAACIDNEGVKPELYIDGEFYE